jgi:hypothetical protein
MENIEPETPVATQEIAIESSPPLITRFKSVIIDQLFIIVCMAMLSQFLPAESSQNTDMLKGVLLFGLFLVYEPFSMAFLGCTIGNLITGVRVRKFWNHEERINIFSAYVRFVVKLSLGWLSFLTITSSDSRRALHDMASGSVMLYAKP